MWTISDFTAYDILFGRKAHGILSCSYCQDSTYAFQLKHGCKTCWFECHRRFLLEDHCLRKTIRCLSVSLQNYLDVIYGPVKRLMC